MGCHRCVLAVLNVCVNPGSFPLHAIATVIVSKSFFILPCAYAMVDKFVVLRFSQAHICRLCCKYVPIPSPYFSSLSPVILTPLSIPPLSIPPPPPPPSIPSPFFHPFILLLHPSFLHPSFIPPSFSSSSPLPFFPSSSLSSSPQELSSQRRLKRLHGRKKTTTLKMTWKKLLS